MKNLLFGLFLAVVGLSSCGDDGGCKTCTLSFLGIETSSEICEDGDDLTVTSSALGVSETETISGTSLDDYVNALEAGGYSCN
jgi:hypothetical protein